LFRLDLLKVFSSNNEKPVGVIIVKNNIVQRRIADRVLWDRLMVDSPAYVGDIIRTANQSTAALRIEDNLININENTLIRILRSPGTEDDLHIVLDGGNLSVNTGYGGGTITLNLMGRHVEIGSDTIINASVLNEGIVLQVNEGSAAFVGEDRRREIPSGTQLSLDANGTESMENVAMIIQPRPNARYLKSTPELLRINFSWVRINLDPGDTLRLELSDDKYFNNIVSIIDNLDVSAEASFDIGFWYWRLSSMGSSDASVSQRFLASGRLTVIDASGPKLLSPVTESLFRYQNDLPRMRFNWSGKEEASSYIIEISESPDFYNPRLRTQTESVFLVNANLGQGTWYWRVAPVFPPVYEGRATFSPASLFRIEQSGDVGLVLPDSEPEPVIEPIIEPIIEQPVIEPPAPVPLKLSLLTPAHGTALPGLTALRQQTIFTWSSDRAVTRSRFVLSQNSNPLRGQPVREINNPGTTIRVNNLSEGVYYWTIEARSSDGLVSVAEPRQLRVTAIPLLPEPANLQPSRGQRIGIEELKTQTDIVFSWSAVQGANAYIFTLYEETGNGRQQIVRRQPENRINWTLENFGILGRGTFVWQVEAVNRNSSSVIEQRGRVGESTFILDVPTPGQVHIEDPGILYGY
jgi:hypothetical protein